MRPHAAWFTTAVRVGGSNMFLFIRVVDEIDGWINYIDDVNLKICCSEPILFYVAHYIYILKHLQVTLRYYAAAM